MCGPREAQGIGAEILDMLLNEIIDGNGPNDFDDEPTEQIASPDVHEFGQAAHANELTEEATSANVHELIPANLLNEDTFPHNRKQQLNDAIESIHHAPTQLIGLYADKVNL